MRNCIGIRRENKDETERRTPLTPFQVMKLVNLHGVHVVVEPSKTRVFSDEEYEKIGAEISEDLSHCNLIFGIKEIPLQSLAEKQAYCFFSHTIKGQPHNMPMLKKIMELKDTLLDYELVTDDSGRRLIFFGNFAGYAGMIDSLWALGLRWRSEGIPNPFERLQPAYKYENLEEARRAITDVGRRIRQEGLPPEVVPFVCGITGYGQVSRGAQDIFDLLPFRSIRPEQLAEFYEKKEFSRHTAYKVVFEEKHMFKARPYNGREKRFNLKEYFKHPERYESKFEQYVPYLSMLINAIYWTPECPKLVTKAYLRELYREQPNPCLKVIGDITCDIDGSIEMTVKATNSANPIYVFDPETEQVQDGYEGRGPVIMAVDKLPAELPREASEFFGNALLPYVPELAAGDYFAPYEKVRIPKPFKKAMIVHRGNLTRNFSYLAKHLPD